MSQNPQFAAALESEGVSPLSLKALSAMAAMRTQPWYSHPYQIVPEYRNSEFHKAITEESFIGRSMRASQIYREDRNGDFRYAPPRVIIDGLVTAAEADKQYELWKMKDRLTNTAKRLQQNDAFGTQLDWDGLQLWDFERDNPEKPSQEFFDFLKKIQEEKIEEWREEFNKDRLEAIMSIPQQHYKYRYNTLDDVNFPDYYYARRRHEFTMKNGESSGLDLPRGPQLSNSD